MNISSFEYYSFDDGCVDIMAKAIVVNIYIQEGYKAIRIFLYIMSTLDSFKYANERDAIFVGLLTY